MKLSAERLPNTPVPGGKGNSLDRIRALLRVAAATLGNPAGSGSIPYFQSGVAFVLTGAALELEQRARASRSPVVVADVEAVEALSRDKPRFVNETPIRFLAILPLGSGDNSPVQLLTLVDSRPRSIDTANRLAMVAIETFYPANPENPEAAAVRLRRDLALIDQATASASLGIWQCHLAGDTLTWSAGVYDLFGIARGAALRRDRTVTHYVDSSRAAMEEHRARAIETGGEFKLDAEIFREDGQKRWMRLTASVQSVNGLAVRLFGTKQDITEERLLVDHMRHLAETDAMTGLANRARLQARLDHPEGINALLLIDLDGFKTINDTYGHAIGDKCLEEAARRLRACCADAPLVGRLGGDEFVVVLHANHRPEHLARRIVEVMQLPFRHAGLHVELGASVGLAFRNNESGEELFRKADRALYAAKAAGRRTSRTFDKTVHRSHRMPAAVTEYPDCQ